MSLGKLLILGFGGHARSVADIALASGYSELVFVDANARPGECFLDFPVIPELGGRTWTGYDAFPASGDGRTRMNQCKLIQELALDIATLVAPTATVGRGGRISSGCLIGHHAHVGPASIIGLGCIINTSAVVDHESRIGDYSHISVNSTVAGRSSVGAFSILGAGGVIIDGVSVCDDVIIGAGAVVVKSIDSPGIYIGCPARASRA